MPTQKWCSVAGCKNFIFARLDDFNKYNWTAVQIPAGNGKVYCFCPQHYEEMFKKIEEEHKRAFLKTQANSTSLSPNMRYQENSAEFSQMPNGTSDNANIMRNLGFGSKEK